MRRLLIRPGAIGDCILSLPVLEWLQTTETELWVPSAILPLIQFTTNVRSIASTGLDLFGVGDLPAPEGLIQRLRSFDSIMSWYGSNRSDFRAAVAALQLPFEFHAALPPPDSTLHATDFFAQQVGAPFGLVPRIHVPAVPRRETIVIHPFSASSRKNWPLEKFRELASHLPLPVEWCTGPEEPLRGATRIENLLELAAWLKGAQLYIGNDSGISHLAAAIGMPVLALFGPMDPRVWSPRGAKVCTKRWEPLPDLESVELLPEIRYLLA
jgi:heptosyltransferase-3